MAVQCVRVTRCVQVNILISPLSLHVFKGWAMCVCVQGRGAREGVGRLYLTNTGIMSLRRPVKCSIFIVCTEVRVAILIRPFLRYK